VLEGVAVAVGVLVGVAVGVLVGVGVMRINVNVPSVVLAQKCCP
jgi:hypothetical protein